MPRRASPSRVCSRCGRTFPRDQVYSSAHCRQCEPIRRREYLATHPEQREKTRRQARAWATTHVAELHARKARRAEARARREADRTARGLHTLREGADLLGVSYSTLAYQARKGVLATVHEGRFLYVDDAEIGRYRREHLRAQDRGDGGDRSSPRAPRGISVAEGAVDERSASGSMIHGGAQNSEPETVGR